MHVVEKTQNLCGRMLSRKEISCWATIFEMLEMSNVDFIGNSSIHRKIGRSHPKLCGMGGGRGKSEMKVDTIEFSFSSMLLR